MDLELAIAVVIAAVCFVGLVILRRNAQYGKIRPSKAVTDAYGDFRVDPGKKYYFSGPEAHPNAIIGIDNEWRLDADLWKAVALDSGRMKEMIEGMRSKALERNLALHGADILDHYGKKVGDWFSVLGIDPTVRAKGWDRLDIETPPIDTYQR
jgi:hypothetical protein